MPSTRYTAAWVAQHQARMAQNGGKTPARPRQLAADLLPRIRVLADREGWRGLHTYNALGPDHGLHIILVREVVIFADLRDEGDPITESQQRWRDALNATGSVETYVWCPDDWDAIKTRLTTQRTATILSPQLEETTP